MAVTQYIGARYVPIFADPAEWDNTRAYEPLTIVLYQGNSYTSAQAVPVGIDITNTEFWKLTGNYNAQIEAYRAEVEQFDGRITTAQETADSAMSAVQAVDAALSTEHDDRIAADTQIRDDLSADLAQEVERLDQQDGGLSNRIANLESDVKDYAIFIGDSYLRGTGTEEGPSGGEGYNSIGNGWGKALATLEGFTVDKVMCIAGGSGGFVKTGTNGGGLGLNFTGMLTKARDLMTAAERKRVRYIVVCGGINDGSDITKTSIRNFFDVCRNDFKDIPVHVFTNMGTRTPSFRLTTGQAKAYQTIEQVAGSVSGSFHETWPLALCSTSLMNPDNTHMLNYVHLGRAMKSAIHGGKITPYQGLESGYVDIEAENGAAFNFPFFYDGCRKVIVQGDITIDTSILPIEGTSPIVLGNIPEGIAPRYSMRAIAMCKHIYNNVTVFSPIFVEITTSGVIRCRRINSVNTTVEGNVPTQFSFAPTGTVDIYLPNIAYEII